MPLIDEVVLGGAVGALIQAIFIAKDKAAFFKKTLEHLESTLQSVGPIMEQVIKSEDIHDTDVCKRFIQQLEKARVLVEMYSDIQMWKLLKKRKVKKLIQAMDASLRQFLTEDFQVEQLLYLTIIDKDVFVINEKMDRIIALLRENKLDAATSEEHSGEEILSSPEKNESDDRIDGKKGCPLFELHWRMKREKCLDICFWRNSDEYKA